MTNQATNHVNRYLIKEKFHQLDWKPSQYQFLGFNKAVIKLAKADSIQVKQGRPHPPTLLEIDTRASDDWFSCSIPLSIYIDYKLIGRNDFAGLVDRTGAAHSTIHHYYRALGGTEPKATTFEHIKHQIELTAFVHKKCFEIEEEGQPTQFNNYKRSWPRILWIDNKADIKTEADRVVKNMFIAFNPNDGFYDSLTLHDDPETAIEFATHGFDKPWFNLEIQSKYETLPN